MVYAWQGSGKLVWSQTLIGPNDFASPVLVDLTGSGTEIGELEKPDVVGRVA